MASTMGLHGNLARRLAVGCVEHGAFGKMVRYAKPFNNRVAVGIASRSVRNAPRANGVASRTLRAL